MDKNNLALLLQVHHMLWDKLMYIWTFLDALVLYGSQPNPVIYIVLFPSFLTLSLPLMFYLLSSFWFLVRQQQMIGSKLLPMWYWNFSNSFNRTFVLVLGKWRYFTLLLEIKGLVFTFTTSKRSMSLSFTTLSETFRLGVPWSKVITHNSIKIGIHLCIL